MMDFTFRRGDICWFNDPVAITPGTYVSHGRHPSIVVSDDGNNFNGDTVIIAPMTSNVAKRIYPGQFDIVLDGHPSRVRCDQLRVVDKHTLEKPIAKLSIEGLIKLDEAIMSIMGIGGKTGFTVAGLI